MFKINIKEDIQALRCKRNHPPGTYIQPIPPGSDDIDKQRIDFFGCIPYRSGS